MLILIDCSVVQFIARDSTQVSFLALISSAVVVYSNEDVNRRYNANVRLNKAKAYWVSRSSPILRPGPSRSAPKMLASSPKPNITD